jgi:Secretion system C-terminal sorting domain
MKHYLFFLLVFCTCTDTVAQVPNLGFEEWDYVDSLNREVPKGWNTDAGFLFKDSSAFEGKFAALFNTWYHKDAGIFFNGSRLSRQGSSLSYKPSQLKGMYKLRGAPANSVGSVYVYLWRYDRAIGQRDTVGAGRERLFPSKEYTPFKVPILYSSDLEPDSIALTFYTADFGTDSFCGHDTSNCSFMNIDALELEKSTPATEVQSGKMSITPNPSEGAIRLQFDAAVSGRGRVVITDTTGKSLVDKLYSAENQDIDLGFLPLGVYYVAFHPENAAGKILVEKWIKK